MLWINIADNFTRYVHSYVLGCYVKVYKITICHMRYSTGFAPKLRKPMHAKNVCAQNRVCQIVGHKLQAC